LTNELEVLVSETLLSVTGSPLILGIFVLILFVAWIAFSKIDRSGIVFIGIMVIGTLRKMNFIPEWVWGATIIICALLILNSLFRPIGES